jgi:hypothetical protein
MEFRDFSLCFSFVRFLSDARFSCSACWWQELERRARERYIAFDRLDAEFRWCRGQYEALEALVEALWPPDGWVESRAAALLDSPPEQGAQAAEGASAVVRVRTVLVERNDALRRAREDLENVRSLVSTWEVEVATARAQLQQGRAALQEAEGLKTALTDKTVALATAEEKLRQERAARQEVEGQLQRERAALVEARAVLEQERMAREEALCQLRQERTALEEVRATLQKKEEEVSRLDGELVQLSISHEDLCQSLEEQEASYLKLQREAEERRRSLEVEKKQVEGEFVSFRFLFVDSFFWDPLPTSSLSYSWLPGLQTALGHATTRAETLQTAYNSSQQELEGLRAVALETCQEVEDRELTGKPPARSRRARLEADAPRSPPGHQEGSQRGEVSL